MTQPVRTAPTQRHIWWRGMDEHGVQCPDLSPDDEARVLQLIAAGKSSSAVAKELGQPLVMIAEVLFRHGVQPSWVDPASLRTGPYVPPPAPWAGKARLMADAGFNGKEIAVALGISTASVWKWAKKEGRTVAKIPRGKAALARLRAVA